MDDKDKDISYDTIFKAILGEMPDELIIELINKLFKKRYSKKAAVKRLATESHENLALLNSDAEIGINNDTFHFEIEESGANKEMALRVVKYSFRSALKHGKTQGKNFVRLKFPESVVVYLRSARNAPNELNVELVMPDGKTVDCKIPVKKLSDYSAKDLTDGSNIIFSPFYPMSYQGKPLKTRQTREKIINDVFYILSEIKAKADNNKISQTIAGLIINPLKAILENALLKSKVPQKEVCEIMDAAAKRYFLEPLILKAEGKAEDAKKMFEKGFSLADIQDITGLSVKTLERLRKENDDKL